MVEDGPFCIVLAFTGSNPSSQSRREGTGEASRHLQAVKGAVEVLNGLRASRGPR